MYISVPRADFHQYQLEAYPQGSNYRKTSINKRYTNSITVTHV